MDYELIKTTLMGMKQNINEMHILVEHHERGTVRVAGIDVSYDATQIQALIDEYTAKKAELVAKFAQLP